MSKTEFSSLFLKIIVLIKMFLSKEVAQTNSKRTYQKLTPKSKVPQYKYKLSSFKFGNFWMHLPYVINMFFSILTKSTFL